MSGEAVTQQADLLADYRPTEPILDVDIIRAEAFTTVSMDTLNTSVQATHALALEILNSLKRTAKSGQRVIGDIFNSRDPLTAIKSALKEMAQEATAKTPKTPEVLPKGAVKGIVTNRVHGGWLVKPANGNGKNFTLLDQSISKRLQAGDEVLVTLTDIVNDHGRIEVKPYVQAQA